MKRIVTLGMTMVMSLSLASTTLVFAEVNTNTTTKTTTEVKAQPTNTTTNTTTTTATEDKTKTDDAAALKARLEKRKTELKIKLSLQEKTRIVARCVAAQGLVSSVKGRETGIETSRKEVYGNIITRLTDLSEKLKNKGVDTTTLNADISTLKGDVDTFNTDLTAYKQAVLDLAAVDCKTDPDGFKASLLAARTALETLNKDSTTIRTYLNGTIKPLLVTLRKSLETNKTSTGGSN